MSVCYPASLLAGPTSTLLSTSGLRTKNVWNTDHHMDQSPKSASRMSEILNPEERSWARNWKTEKLNPEERSWARNWKTETLKNWTISGRSEWSPPSMTVKKNSFSVCSFQPLFDSSRNTYAMSLTDCSFSDRSMTWRMSFRTNQIHKDWKLKNWKTFFFFLGNWRPRIPPQDSVFFSFSACAMSCRLASGVLWLFIPALSARTTVSIVSGVQVE